MVVEVATLRHFTEEREEQRRILFDRIEIARRRNLAGRRRLRRERHGCQHGDRRRPGEAFHDHRTRVPGSGGVSNVTTVGLPPSGLAASTMPLDSMPINFAGFRLKTTTTVLPTSDSGS
jgi:hypothetical protein